MNRGTRSCMCKLHGSSFELLDHCGIYIYIDFFLDILYMDVARVQSASVICTFVNARKLQFIIAINSLSLAWTVPRKHPRDYYESGSREGFADKHRQIKHLKTSV